MKNLLNNSWFVNIACSLIVGFITFIGSTFVKIIRHHHKIADANRLVVDQLRTFIVNSEEVPHIDIILSLRRSAARKYNLKPEELLDPISYLEDVISEMVGNVYLSAEDQRQYLVLINTSIQKEKIKLENTLNEPDKNTKKHMAMELAISFFCAILSYIVVFFI